MSELKVDPESPIRVRVSRRCYAESLVEMAEECGWEPFVESVAELKPQVWDDEMCLHFALEDRKLIDLDPCQPHSPILDYRDDLPQIEAWLEANAESEDECETCNDNKFIHRGNGPEDCPDCTGDEPEWEPCPPHSSEAPSKRACPESAEDDCEVDAEFVKNILWELCDITNRRSVGEYGEIIDSIVKRFRDLESELSETRNDMKMFKRNYEDEMVQNYWLEEEQDELREELKKYKDASKYWEERYHDQDDTVEELKEELESVKRDVAEWKLGYMQRGAKIAELQEELEDVREELFHKESYIQRLRERLNNVRRAFRSNQERIEEAGEKVAGVLNSEYGVLELDNALKILTPDSDEGDGCGELE